MSQLKFMQDDDLPIWLPRLAVHGGPRFLQIADALQAAVADKSLKPGDRLTPQRKLAAQLDVDLTTIIRAYIEARRRNLTTLETVSPTTKAPMPLKVSENLAGAQESAAVE